MVSYFLWLAVNVTSVLLVGVAPTLIGAIYGDDDREDGSGGYSSHEDYSADVALEEGEAPDAHSSNYSVGHFFVDHAAAMKIPTKVMCFTTSDLYREGYRQDCRKIKGKNVTDEHRLTCKLLHNYSPQARPVLTVNSTLVVNFTFAINQIFDLDDRNQVLVMNVWFEQTWVDAGLTWDPAEFGGITSLNIPSFYLFLPDIELYNTAADYTKKRAQFRAMVTYDGTVFYGNPAKLTSTCHVNPTWFPFDYQVCHLKFGSWTHSGLEIDLQPARDGVDMSRLISHGKWDLVEVLQKRHAIVYTCCPEPYIDISYYVVLKRRAMYYLLNVYFFTVMLAVMTLAVYQLPIDSGEKCGLGTAVLFSVSVFMLSLGEKLPESSDYVPIINIYLFLIMGTSAISLMLTIFVHAIHFQHINVPKGSRMPQIRRVPKLLMNIVHFYRRRVGSWVEDAVRERQARYDAKKELIKKLRSYQRCIDFEMRHLPFTRPSDSPPFQAKKPHNGQLSELTPSATFPVDETNNILTAANHRKAPQRLDFYEFTMINRINEVSVAIEYLADRYEAQLSRALNIIEWHELAKFCDVVLFWLFLLMLICAISFVFGYASMNGPSGQDIIRNFEHRHDVK